MISIPAYFDGNAVRPLDNYTFSKDQKLFILIQDDGDKEKADGIKALKGSLSEYANPDLIPLESEEISYRLSLLENLQKYRGRLSPDLNAEEELAQAREQKYSK